MKSYTDLEQSKKLAEILPIESADMFYRDNGIDVKLMWEHNAQKVENPCWSLAALLQYLREIDFFPEIEVNKTDIIMKIFYYEDDSDKQLVPVENIIVCKETFIDAVVEFIIKLKEMDLL